MAFDVNGNSPPVCPYALCGIVTLIVVFCCGSRTTIGSSAILWGAAYGGSLFRHSIFKSGIIDPWFNLCYFLSFIISLLYHWKRMASIRKDCKGAAYTM